MGSRIIGCNTYIPERIITNKDIVKNIDSTEEWIEKTTGIHQRHIADTPNIDMAYKASVNVLEASNISSMCKYQFIFIIYCIS